MRGILGTAVLVIGVGALGWYGQARKAPAIENAVHSEALAVSATTRHGIDVAVSGRDIVASGLIEDAEELGQVLAALDRIPGRRTVNAEQLLVLPRAEPFRLSADWTDGAWNRIDGYAPTTEGLRRIADAAGLGSASLTLASGVPDRNWTDAVLAALSGARPLEDATLEIRGLEVHLSGTALTPSEADVAETAIRADLPDGYDLSLSIVTLDDGRPFGLDLDYSQGVLSGTGKLPAGFTGLSGAPEGLQYSVLADEDWANAASTALVALQQLNSGALTIADRSISITGLALPERRAEAMARLDEISPSFDVAASIDLFDDGAPFSLSVALSGEPGVLTGKLPADLAPRQLLGALPPGYGDETNKAFVADETGVWPDIATKGVAALSHLRTGELTIQGNVLRLTGAGSPDALDNVAAILGGLAEPARFETDLTLWDDGKPFALQATYDGQRVDISGKVPSDTSIDTLSESVEGLTLLGEVETAFIGDPSGIWPGIAEAGLSALGEIETGSLTVTGLELEISGTARLPSVEQDIRASLGALPDEVRVSLNLTFLDDGSPANWELEYDATDGGRVGGKLPTGLEPDDLATQLGLDSIGGEPLLGLVDGDATDSLSALAIVADYLPGTENLTLTVQDEHTILDMSMAPDTDIEIVALDLSERLPVSVEFSIGPTEVAPTEGDVRTNAATGRREMFRGESWIPVLTFAVARPICDAEARSAIEEGGITFLSGSARLDGRSVRTINHLSAVVVRCLGDGNLQVEVGGHTDATGDAAANRELSRNRAEVVRDALVQRGAAPEAIVAVGYGSERPVADNETEEGRAANRRTELTWSEIPVSDTDEQTGD